MEEIYLITGVLGHLGSTVARHLLEQGKTVRGFDQERVIHNDLLDLKIELFTGDVRDKKSLRSLFEGLENKQVYVIHCAGIVSIKSSFDQRVYDVNVNGTKNVMDLCFEYSVFKVVHVSSVHAILEGPKDSVIREVTHFNKEDVEGLYAKTKAEASQYVLDMVCKGLPVVIVHPSGIIGPYDLGNGHLTSMILDYCNHKLTALVKGGYDFVDVRDVADGILLSLEKGKTGECYILSNRYFSIQEIMDMVAQITNRKKIKTILPLWFAKLTAPLAEMFYKLRKKPPLYTSYSLYTLHANAIFSHDKATKKLGYTPRDMKETLKDTIKFLEENHLITHK